MFTRLDTHTRLIGLYADRRQQARDYSPAFVAATTGQDGAWSHEVRLVLTIASQLGMRLDEDMLAFSDVHDLQALRAALAEHLCHSRAGSVRKIA